MPTFDVILTVWNRLEYTKRTVASLIASGAVADCERFIVVDNRSLEAGMDEFLNDLYSNVPNASGKVFLIRRNKNDGWAAAVNDALGLSRAEYVFLSNNDVEYSYEFYKRMFDIFSHQSEIGILGVWRHTAHAFLNANKGGVQNEWFREMDNLPAVGWMIPRKAINQIGVLSEHGPCFTKGGNGEDVDYCMRMINAGFKIGVPSEDLGCHLDGY